MALELPDAISLLIQDLQARGYTVTEQTYDERAFGNALIELEPGRTGERKPRVRIVKDRGLWAVDIKIADQWRDLFPRWLALENAPYQRRALNHDERRRLTLEVVTRLPEANLSDVQATLDEYKRAYWREHGVASPD